MRKPIIVGNWKMQLGPNEALKLASGLRKNAKSMPLKKVDVVVCPEFVTITDIMDELEKLDIYVGAQDCDSEYKGARTGEVSAKSLWEIGCEYVIIGHSERRALGETDKEVNAKLNAALAVNLLPIVCVGESQEERNNGSAEVVVARQVTDALKNIHLGPDKELVIAYEPIWAIGTGKTVEPDEANHMCQVIRQTLLDAADGNDSYIKKDQLEKIRTIYGGSANNKNAASFLEQEAVDGLLPGGASLKVDSFTKMVQAAGEIV